MALFLERIIRIGCRGLIRRDKVAIRHLVCGTITILFSLIILNNGRIAGMGKASLTFNCRRILSISLIIRTWTTILKVVILLALAMHNPFTYLIRVRPLKLVRKFRKRTLIHKIRKYGSTILDTSWNREELLLYLVQIMEVTLHW